MFEKRRRALVVVVLLIVIMVIVASVATFALSRAPGSSGTTPTGPPGFNGTYQIIFVERGLPDGANWNITVNDRTSASSAPAVTLWLINGTYSYDIRTSAGFSPAPTTGTLAVNGHDFTSEIVFSAPAEPSYSVQFNITQYSGVDFSPWTSVAYLNFSDGNRFSTLDSIIDLSLPNGSYPYTFATGTTLVAPEPYSGVLNVSGEPQWINEAFNHVYYDLTFSESGLSGYLPEWGILFAPCPIGSILGLDCGLPIPSPVPPNLPCGGWGASYGTPDTQSARNGTFTFLVGPTPDCNVPAGYEAIPAYGAVFVNGTATSVSILYVPASTPLYDVNFVEAGLPNGTPWWVVIRGVAEFSNTSTIQVDQTNGTFSYSMHTIAGYAATPGTGAATVSGANHTIIVTFKSV